MEKQYEQLGSTNAANANQTKTLKVARGKHKGPQP